MSQHDTLLSLRESLRRISRGNPNSVYAPYILRIEDALRTGVEAGDVIRDATAEMRKNGHSL